MFMIKSSRGENMLLGVKFSEFIIKANVIFGIVLCAIGVACFILAKRVSQAVDKTDTANKSSKSYITTNIVGLVCVIAGMILIALPL